MILHHHTNWKEAKEPESNLFIQAILSATGEDIPLASHILRLANVVSRLISPGRFVLEQVKEIEAILKEFSGSAFSPQIVDAFMSIAEREYFWLDLVSPYIEDFIREMVSSLVYILGREEVKAIARLSCDFTDFKSQFTAVHSRGVAVVARELAKLSSLSQGEVELIEIAGYFHDSGKLAIPKEILEKPGKLSEKEFNIMKTHPYYAHLALSRIEGLKEIESWASYHHERLDGSGYPFHLQGEEIPLEARILAVADVFSALREKRPYRPVMDKDSIFKVLEEEAKEGKLDSEIVSLLFKHYEEIEAQFQDILLTAMERYQTIWERFSSLLAGEMDIAS